MKMIVMKYTKDDANVLQHWFLDVKGFQLKWKCFWCISSEIKSTWTLASSLSNPWTLALSFSFFFNPNLQVHCEIKSTWTFAFFKSSTISDLNFSNNNIFKPLNAGGKNRQINRNSWWRKQIQLRECAINCEKYMYRMRRNNFWVDSVLTHRWTSARGKIRLNLSSFERKQ